MSVVSFRGPVSFGWRVFCVKMRQDLIPPGAKTNGKGRVCKRTQNAEKYGNQAKPDGEPSLKGYKPNGGHQKQDASQKCY